MYPKTIIYFFLLVCTTTTIGQDKVASATKFNLEKDLLLVHYDCKTDVDDLHSAAAFATLLSKPEYRQLKFHAVGGTYGMQNGLYFPPNALLNLAFEKQWSDAHNSYEQALKTVTQLALKTLNANGNIWIAEGGSPILRLPSSRHLKRRFQILMPNAYMWCNIAIGMKRLLHPKS